MHTDKIGLELNLLTEKAIEYGIGFICVYLLLSVAKIRFTKLKIEKLL